MTAAVLTPAQSRFIEEMGQFLGGYGMTPMAGRMWGWLLLCDPPEQTAAQIAEALQASRGAVSGAARILTTAGFIRRTTRRGDRREYFSSPPEALDSMLSNASVIYRQLRVIAELWPTSSTAFTSNVHGPTATAAPTAAVAASDVPGSATG